MNWITHFDTMATILVSADVASICVSAVFFSERVRRWTYRKRWGSHPAVSTLSYSVAVAGMDDPSIGSIRPQPIATLRNPFEARSREAMVGGTAAMADRDESRRPTFRRSTVLQRRVAAYERALAAGFVTASPQRQNETRSAIVRTEYETLNSYFERFAIGHLQEAHPS
jgi:hypothetical protein